MLNIGLKNAILFFLIILILHFLLKNILIDNKKPTTKPESDSIKQKQQNYFAIEKFTEQRNKMIDYINYADTEAEAKQKIIKTPECDTKCLPRKTDENSLPLSTTCDAGIQELKPEDPMKLKADCQIPQDYKFFSVIKEYENEKGINGGKLYDGLGAYDGFEDYFESYKCGSL